MNKRDFQELLYKRYRFDIWYNKILAYALMVGAAYFTYRIIQDWTTSDSVGRYLSLLLPALLVGSSILFLKMNKSNYKITSLKAKDDIKERQRLILDLSNNLKFTVVQSEHDPAMLLTRGFWRAGYEIFIVFENDLIHFDVQHNGPGIIDFGVRRRITNEIIEYMRPAYNTVHIP